MTTRAFQRQVLAALIAAVTLAAGPAAAGGGAPRCEVLPELMQHYLRGHVRYHELSDEIKQRTIDSYLLSLDSSRTLLTEPELEELRASLRGVFGEIRSGDCHRLLDLQRRLARDYEQAARYVRKVVDAKNYKIDESATLVLDPEKRGYPKSDAERNALLLKLVHFQMETYVGNGNTMAQAKKKLVARYERRLKRFMEVSPDDIYAQFLDSFATSLDPHSNYLSPDVLEDFRIGMSLSLEGIGVALSEQDGYAVAEHIIPGGAADKLGVLKPKDKIIAVAQGDGDFVDIVDMPLREAVGLIRGKAGTKVRLTVLRQGEKTKRFNVEITRAHIDLGEQAASLRFETRQVDGHDYKLAILDLPSFYGDTDPASRQCTDDVARLLKQVNAEHADGLVLDLSRNGGGLLQHAVTISGFFLREGEIVGVEDGSGRRQLLSDRDEHVLYSGPLVIHTSRVSASASEILAGALKDYGRAVIVGDDHTFGKGTVQTVSQLPGNEGALKITTALYFRPGGHSTQHDGVKADVVVPSLLAGDDFGEKTQRYSLDSEQTTPFIGKAANSYDLRQHWEPIRPEWIKVLAKRSHDRLAHSKEFAEVREKIEESEESNGVVRVDELAKRQEEARTEAEKEENEKVHTTPQLEEAVSVLADLVTLSHASTASRDASRPES